MALSPVKQNAITLRVKPNENGKQPTISEVMEAVGRSRQSWYNWMLNDEEFREELKSMYDKSISLTVREEIYWRLQFPNFPLDALLKLYLAEKPEKHEIDAKPLTIVDFLKRAHEEEIESKTTKEL